MQSIPFSFAAFVFVLGILVFVHEFGHYAMAKLFKVRVETFSLGFGKRLIGFRRGDTDYRISLLPLGGYVKMAGENPMEERTGAPDEFMSHPRWQRFLIAIAGPAMNIILAVVVLTGVYMFHYERSKQAEIGWVIAGSPAEQAGIKPGDKVVKIEDVQNPTWEQTDQSVAINPDQAIDVSVQRGDQIIQTKLKPVPFGPERAGDAGWEPQEPAMVGTVDPELPAAKAGIQPGDIVVALNGTPVRNFREMIRFLQEIKDNPAEVTVLRDSQTLKFTLKPQYGDAGGSGQKRYVIGVTPGYKTIVEQLTFRDAFATAFAECKSNAFLIFKLVGKMFEHKVSIKQMSGPVGIMKYAGIAAKLGLPTLLKFMALISLNLAVFNLLPIPILDGGLMLMLIVESVMRRDIKQEVKERVYQAAFVFLVLFAAVVIFNDVTKTLPAHFK
jgi:regulator of sigma E protease